MRWAAMTRTLMTKSFRDYLADLPLVAILRGLRPENAEIIGHALVEAGFRVIEVPLNSPEPFRSIEVLARTMPDGVLVGAGTVLEPAAVDRVRDAGGRRDADRGLRGPEGGSRCAEDIPGRTDSTPRRESLARGAPAGDDRAASGRHQARHDETVPGR